MKLTGPNWVLGVESEEPSGQGKLRAICGSSFVSICRYNENEGQNIGVKYRYVPQKVGSLSSTNTPRGGGNWSWK